MAVIDIASSLTSYYSALLARARAQSSAPFLAAAPKKNTATSNDKTPWSTPNKNQTALDTSVLLLKNFVDTSKIPLHASTADTKAEQDNQKLFALYVGFYNLDHLAVMANRQGVTSGTLAGLNARFQTGLSQVESYLSSTSFNNLTLQAQKISDQTTSTVLQPLALFAYTGKTVVSNANVNSPLASVSSTQNFSIALKKAGVTTNVLIDLSKVQGGLTLGNIVSYINQQLVAGGFSTRFQKSITQGSITDLKTAAYGVTINAGAGEAVSLSSAAAVPSIYLAGSTGTASATSTQSVDVQGRLVKLSGLSSSSPSPVYNSTTKPDSGTSTATSTVVDANGNVYMLGQSTGSFGSQIDQAKQDVYLSKYDSAGKLLWTKLVGLTGTASAASLALNPKGGVVVAGTSNRPLTAGSVINGNNSSFVASYDGLGNIQWTKQIQTLSANQAHAVSVDASGNIYLGGSVKGVIGTGQTYSSAGAGYVVKLDKTGKIVSEKQFNAAGSSSVAATALTSNGSLITARVENGHAIISKYANGDANSTPLWTQDLGALQSGTISGLNVSGSNVYISGTTANTNLTAGGLATIAAASKGSTSAFVFAMTDNGNTVTPNHISYVGTGSGDKGAGLAVASDGTIYLTGTTNGTFQGQTRMVASVPNMLVSAVAANGNVLWSRQYGGTDGKSTGSSVAVDNQGASVLDALGLPRGPVGTDTSATLSTNSTLRSGDSFRIKFYDAANTTITISIAAGETLQSLVTKINGRTVGKLTASIAYGANGEELKLTAGKGVKAELLSGPADFDALGRLEIRPGALVSSTWQTTSKVASTTKSSPSAAQTFSLNLPSAKMDISTKAGATLTHSQLLQVLSALQSAYQKTNTPPGSTTGTNVSSPGNASPTLRAKIAGYNTALSLLGG